MTWLPKFAPRGETDQDSQPGRAGPPPPKKRVEITCDVAQVGDSLTRDESQGCAVRQDVQARLAPTGRHHRAQRGTVDFPLLRRGAG